MATVNAARSTRQNRNSRRRRPAPNRDNPRLILAAAAGTALTLTFDRPVMLAGVPQMTTDVPLAVPVSASQPTPIAQVIVEFDIDITAATVVNLMPNDPAIRGLGGGYVASGQFPA